MTPMRETKTIKIWKETLRLLRHIHAETGETMTAILQRIVSAEWQRMTKAENSNFFLDNS